MSEVTTATSQESFCLSIYCGSRREVLVQENDHISQLNEVLKKFYKKGRTVLSDSELSIPGSDETLYLLQRYSSDVVDPNRAG